MIEATSTNIVLPDDVQAAIISARNNVSLLEAEAVRLERLIGSQKRELVSLDGALNDIKTQIDTLTERRICTAKEISLLEEEKSKANNELNSIISKSKKAEKDFVSRENKIIEDETSIVDAKEDIKKTVAELNERTSKITAEELGILDKKKLINELLSKL